jgi:hypothetical protein
VTEHAQRLVRFAALEQVEVEQINAIGDGHRLALSWSASYPLTAPADSPATM